MLTPGNWIAIAAIVAPTAIAIACWAAAMLMRTGQVLQEIQHISESVSLLAVALEAQEKRIENHDTRITVIETEYEINKVRVRPSDS